MQGILRQESRISGFVLCGVLRKREGLLNVPKNCIRRHAGEQEEFVRKYREEVA